MTSVILAPNPKNDMATRIKEGMSSHLVLYFGMLSRGAQLSCVHGDAWGTVIYKMPNNGQTE